MAKTLGSSAEWVATQLAVLDGKPAPLLEPPEPRAPRVPWPADMRFEDDPRAPRERGGLMPPRPATRMQPGE